MLSLWMRDAVYATALTAASPWLVYRSLRTGRYRQGWRDKLLGLPPTHQSVHSGNPNHDQQTTVWLHGVSVGEVQLLKPLLDSLIAQRPDLQFAISTSTTTGMELAVRLFADSVKTFYFPLDFTWAVQRTLNALRPNLLVLGELELWPNLVSLCHRRKIPVAIVNGRLSERSFGGYQRLSPLTSSTFKRLDLVCAQNATYAKRFRDCGVSVENIDTTGSIKFDNVATDRHSPPVQQLRQLVGLEHSTEERHAHRVFMLGSSQGPEELASLRAFVRVRKQYPTLKLIVVPRHRERFDEAYHQLLRELRSSEDGAQVQLVRRSSLTSPLASDRWDVLLVDTIGELRWWWGLADAALVGGSFGSRGGQNMIEPAAFGASLAFGPRTENFRDVVLALLDAQAAERLPGTEAIAPWLDRQLSDTAQAQLRGQRAQQLILAQQGALDRTVSALLKLLPAK